MLSAGEKKSKYMEENNLYFQITTMFLSFDFERLFFFLFFFFHWEMCSIFIKVPTKFYIISIL